MSDTPFETQYELIMKPKLVELRQRGNRWLSSFWVLVFGGWGFAMWILFAESISFWWLVPLALAILITGMVAFGEINGLRRAFGREVLGKLYAAEFMQTRYDPDGQIDSEALRRAGLFPALFGEQRRELHDRLDCVHQSMPLMLCSADISLPGEYEHNRPGEQLFVGTLFMWQAHLPLSEPVVLVCGETPVQPMPPGLELGRLQHVLPGHPALDKVVRVLCNSPAVARAALPRGVVLALADFVARHSGPWRVVLDANGFVGGVDGPLLIHRIHPRSPLPKAAALRADVERVKTVLDLVNALTEGRRLA